jgi:single stranded DNA-binding protein
MALNDTYMTIVGNVVDAPRMRLTKSGHAVTNFRVASTSRRYDQEQQRYVDNCTLFVNVTCWRAMAENVAFSVHKGQPVLVTGRYYSREYEINETVRISYELEANSVGHDLGRGTQRVPQGDQAERDGQCRGRRRRHPGRPQRRVARSGRAGRAWRRAGRRGRRRRA